MLKILRLSSMIRVQIFIQLWGDFVMQNCRIINLRIIKAMQLRVIRKTRYRQNKQEIQFLNRSYFYGFTQCELILLVILTAVAQG